MKTSVMYTLLQKIRLLSFTLSYDALLKLYYNNPIAKDIITQLQTN